MRQKYLLIALLFVALGFNSCSKDDEYLNISEDEYSTQKKTGPQPEAAIKLDLSQVPLPKLSDYRFFTGALKDQKPNYLVIPYKPASDLFSDYAHKKRFVWMPKGTHATYVSDDNIFVFPVGTVFIKTFYYDNVQPGNVTKIIETRLLIKKYEATENDSGWKLYDYVWNEEQTEAYLDTEGNGIFVPITFTENNVTRSINYKIPASTECATCHKLNPTQSENGEIAIPIGPKPQNLNTMFNYGTYTKNQLTRWKAAGYLDNSLPSLASINSTVDWRDTSQPLEKRVRSYVDINCAHCHRLGGHCDYVPMRFNYSNPNLAQFGVCMVPTAQIDGGPFVINGGRADQSEMIIRMGSTEESVMMPIIGRTIVHEEGVQLISDWINSLSTECN
ncbi:hypothetical protein [Flavobacterium sp.]|uniref:hypothetical protein n=1 Tax=Flavobacterium sp. TaxID=239 RepID=UPI0039E5E652